ncbi:MAG TPA: hypothetical protein VL400_05815, partial [Polyangiaceae bacterium]|nr:hypothetical protein [Polyangiaceae bacterium]
TSVMDRPPATDPADEQSADKAYVAPRTVPQAALPASDADAPKIVLNLPENKGPADSRQVAAARARRRAPTVKLARGTLAARAGAPPDEDDDDGAEDLAPEPTLLEIPIDTAAMEALAPDLAGARAAKPPPRPPGSAITPVEPIADAPGRSNLPRLGPPRVGEPPATALHVSEAPPSERSKAPWVIGGLLLLGAAAVGAFVVTRGDSASDRSTGAARTDTAATAAPTATATATAAAPTATATADVAPTASAVVLDDAATASATATAPIATAPPPVATAPRTAVAPTSTWRPPATTGAKPAYTGKKTEYIPSGI